MGWNDEHLHQFLIHGKRYGVYHSGGILFNENTHQVKLSDFRFRQTRNFSTNTTWAITGSMRFVSRRFCHSTTNNPIQSARVVSPRHFDCGGAWNYMERQQTVPVQASELFSEMFANDSALVADYVEELQALSPWLNLEHFDRTVNRCLRLYALRG